MCEMRFFFGDTVHCKASPKQSPQSQFHHNRQRLPLAYELVPAQVSCAMTIFHGQCCGRLRLRRSYVAVATLIESKT